MNGADCTANQTCHVAELANGLQESRIEPVEKQLEYTIQGDDEHTKPYTPLPHGLYQCVNVMGTVCFVFVLLSIK